MSRRAKRFLAVVVVLGAIGYLGFTAFSPNAVYYVTVDEFLSDQGSYQDQRVRVAGAIEGDSVVYDPAKPELRFQISEAGESLPVVYQGLKPDAFGSAVEAVAEGELKDGVFYADNLLLKCPSRYEMEGEQAGMHGSEVPPGVKAPDHQ